MEEMKYSQSGIDKKIIEAVTEMGFDTMTPIQQMAIPALMEGYDIIGQAQTGTGKTAAFGIPAIEKIDVEGKYVQVIILCPTRELAIQVADEMRRFTKYSHGVKMAAVFGGQDMSRQIRAIKGAQIIVGTPGRVMDHMRRRTLKLENIKMVILDEADEMLNMGFREDIETILEDVPQERQTALFSATMPKAIMDITNKYQRNPQHIKTKQKELTISNIEQYYFEIKSKDKEEVLCRLLDYHDPKKTLIFCKTKRGADALSGDLKARGYHAEPLHGDLSQGQRNAAMAQFRHGKANILIATDVAARGIDVDDVEAVFNYDIPMEEEYYVHRIGRTGRAGRKGKSFTFVVGKEIYKLRNIEGYCKTKIEKGALPSAVSVTKSKSDKILNQALRMVKKNDMGQMKKLIRKKLEENGSSLEDLAGALLKMQMGEDVQEISEPESVGRNRNHRKKGHSRRSREYGKSGKSRESGSQEKESNRGKSGKNRGRKKRNNKK